jgi:alpha-1,2-mannosyltransferase
MSTRSAGPISCTSARAELWQLALVVVAVLTIVLVFLPLTPAYDLEVFLRAGHAVLRGVRVYPSPSSPAVYSGSAFVYPYVAVLPFLPLAAVTSGLAITLFFIAGAGAVVSASFVGSGRDGLIALLVLGTAFTITGLQLGALSPLLFAGAVFLWRLRDRPAAFGVLAAAVVVSKLFLAPLLAWPLLAGRRRAFAWAACSVLALLAVGFAIGPLGPLAYAQLLAQLGAHEATAGFGLTGALMTAGLAPVAAEVVAALVATAVLGATYLRFRQTRDEPVLFCGAIVASLIASPVLWSHYLVLLAAALLARRAPRRSFLLLALASWALAPSHGITIHMQASQAVASHGAWLALAITLTVCGYAMRRRLGPVDLTG